jgi:hypothetical protein
MKYQPGDTVAFTVPISKQASGHGTKRHQERFNIGVIKAVLDQQKAYQISALLGKAYLIREAQISGIASITQSNPGRDSYALL